MIKRTNADSTATPAEGRAWISVDQAAREAGVSVYVVRRMLRRGLPGSRRIGRRWQLEAAQWRDYIAERTR